MNGYERSACTREECATLVDRFLRPLRELPGDVRPSRDNRPGSSGREQVELLGRCLWDVLSDNHEVIDARGGVYDLGSFRGSGEFIATRMETRYPELARFGYLDFDMGTVRASGPPPVYRWIFAVLKEASCDWIYAFPRLHLLRIGGNSADERGFLDYEPSKAVADELEGRDRDRAADEPAALRLPEAVADPLPRRRTDVVRLSRTSPPASGTRRRTRPRTGTRRSG